MFRLYRIVFHDGMEIYPVQNGVKFMTVGTVTERQENQFPSTPSFLYTPISPGFTQNLRLDNFLSFFFVY